MRLFINYGMGVQIWEAVKHFWIPLSGSIFLTSLGGVTFFPHLAEVHAGHGISLN